MKIPSSSAEYIKKITNPWVYWSLMGLKLPSIIFWGLKLKKLDRERCEVMIPFRFTTQNPFRSIYFAALNGAAELSTGIPVQMLLCDKGRASMLVTGFSATFIKKASTDTLFVCSEITKLQNIIESLSTECPKVEFHLESIGYNTLQEVVCRMNVHWSIKLKL
jgi:hypothetical protein